MSTVEETLLRLEKSTFRAGFRLKDKEKEYIREKGMDVIKEHAREFIKQRLSPAYIPNDGKQTPTKGHPVFIAQHACACCCRKCLEKWYKVPADSQLTEIQQEKIINLLMAWIEKQMKNK